MSPVARFTMLATVSMALGIPCGMPYVGCAETVPSKTWVESVMNCCNAVTAATVEISSMFTNVADDRLEQGPSAAIIEMAEFETLPVRPGLPPTASRYVLMPVLPVGQV